MSIRIFLLLLIAVLVVMIGCSSSDNSTPRNKVPESIEKKAQNLIADLTAQGYEVTRGYFFLFGNDECQYAIETMGNCYGNNPLAPYITAAVLPWHEEFMDLSTRNAFGLMPKGYNSIYRFDPREAIIILGLLPPPAKYFGLQTYIFTREGSSDEWKGDPIYNFIAQFGNPQILKQFFDYSPNPKRLRIFGSIGNSNNNIVITNQSGAAFDQERFFIITPDHFMERNMREALLKAGAPDAKNIFVEPVSSTYKAGLHEEAYDFVTWIRYALPDEKTKGDVWRKDLPLVVLRVRDKNTVRQPEPYPLVVLDMRTAKPENWLNNDLQKLVEAVKERWGQPDAGAKPIIDLQTTVDLVGPHCNNRGMNCLGDTQDTSYQGTLYLYLDNNEVYAAVGTLATETDNATYVSLSVYPASTLSGVGSIEHTHLKDTAKGYAEKVNNTDKLYVYYFARDCGDIPACFSITKDMVPKGESFRLIQRNYIKPNTARGPDSTQTLSPVMVILNGGKL